MTLVRPEDWRPRGIDDLEQSAWDALRETQRSVCVTAGAGAGKTEFLAQKAAYLLQTGLCPSPKRILAISFKRDAARNLGSRVQERCEPAQARRLDSMTFDAFTKHLLDRFRATIPAPYTPPPDYRIMFPGRNDYNQFLQDVPGDLNAQQLERHITRLQLPIEAADLPEQRKTLLAAYWRHHYQNLDEPALSFAMINRLIDYMLRTNAQIKKGLQLSYPYVFLDEFQDTTFAQFQLLRTAFSGSNAVFTAVGDDKQRIMGWADAMPNAFQVFTERVDPRPVSLLLNWRSHNDLVAIQQAVAARINPQAPHVEARGIRTVDGDVAAIWDFSTREEECASLARWLGAQIDAQIIEPHEVAILVRQGVNVVENELAPALLAQGLALRNIARSVGDITIQDLLCEELTAVLLPLLRLGASNRDGEAWSKAQIMMRYILAFTDDDEIGQQQLQRKLQEFTRALQTYLSEAEPDPDAVREAIRRCVEFVGVASLRQAFAEYGRDADFERVRAGFELLMIECARDAVTWIDTLDQFEGRNQIALMTVHRSKGLEFHTMIFFGLDGRTWWSLNRGDAEEINAFFVALTRAKQRAFFTSCAQRGNAIAWIDELLGPAGVLHVNGAVLAA